MNRRDFKLRTLVDMLVLMSVLTTLTVSVIVGYEHEKKSLIQTTFQLNKIYADKLADTVNGLVINLKQVMGGTGVYVAQNADLSDRYDILQLLRHNHSSLSSVTLIDRTGVITDASPVQVGLQGQHVSGVVARLFAERKYGISEAYATEAGVLSVALVQPLFDERGEFLGALSGTISLHESNLFNTVLSDSMKDTEGTYVYVVGSRGELIYHPDPTRIGEDVSSNPAVQDILHGESGVRRIKNSKGVDMLASYTYMNETGWGIIAQTPTEVVLNEARHLVLQMLAYVVPILLAFLIGIYVAIGKMSQPLVRLAQYAQKLSADNLIREEPPRIHSWLYEANKLHQALGVAVKHLRSEFDHLSVVAQTDSLTGLYNRRTMEAYLHNLVGQNKAFAFLLIDIDRFKLVNDQEGHETGDKVLQLVASILQSCVDGRGYCFRFGGEEFVILLPDQSLEAALEEAERIRQSMETNRGYNGRKVTLSIGVAAYPLTTSEPDKLFEQADKALYRAKSGGRNRVESA
ncbi:sensor domain-containing diguanylate cyclase [Paenibacillus sp. GCM10023248]|uniref:sensor domain-containing diguanylate cyclase n=1 Tax=Bacillales TaxID=1385 RepID=UPI002379590A|nr:MULTISPECIES: sensor domain-containing diguanylate cyclase [Bacillales]MDD9267580.1 sensor domain-containing diguanylate cyclase [Paenibacillus sp. MAHUQ-63]MDR6884392.1 diguanylate cyclase (GGDEF)-like protein [Bacillus sp. 3255]